ncbi:AMP-binding protein [Candidatus Scalindua japonica]|nr:AMP-binding protein [Candidatus Scalindua japonica]
MKTENKLLYQFNELAQSHPDDLAVRFYNSSTNIQEVTYGWLYREAARVSNTLTNKYRLPSGEGVGIFLETSLSAISSIYGIWLAHGVIVSLPLPTRKNDLDYYLFRLRTIINQTNLRFIIAGNVSERMLSKLDVKVTVIQSDQMVKKNKILVNNNYINNSDEVSLIQYTSGSTSSPKGVRLSHNAVANNVESIKECLDLNNKSKALGWLPLSHDMGLIGTVLLPVYSKCEVTLFPPMRFILNPKIWVQLLSKYKITVTIGPNFAYNLCARKFPEELLSTIDLRSLQHCLVGSEPVKSKTLEDFIHKFKKAGLRAESLKPCYGLAENVVAVSIFKQECAFIEEPHPGSNGNGNRNQFVSMGKPLQGILVAIMDNSGKLLSDNQLGEIAIKGHSLMSGYVGKNPEYTFTKDGWYLTGDLGWKINGQLYIAGRKSDVIIRSGVNYYAHDIENELNDLEGLRQGGIVCFGVTDDEIGTERIIIWVEIHLSRKAGKYELENEINNRVFKRFGFKPDRIEIFHKRVIPKTSSGKIRRFHCKDIYLKNQRT